MRWIELNIDLKGKTAGSYKVKCPKCGEGKRSTAKDLSVNITEGLFNCHNPKCNWSGSAKEYEPKRKDYILPEFNNTSLSDKTLAWFTDTRGISKATLLRMKVTEQIEYMPQESKEMNCIVFNYFRGEAVINKKFRAKGKLFKMVKDAELIFYGLDCIEGQKDCVVCEGEIDQLSFYEAGITSVVSVPNGASKGNAKLEYLDNCYQAFEDKEKIYLATDTDEPGLILREELARRLGKHRCWVINFHEGCKDGNDVLVKHGAKELEKCYNEAIQYPLEGIFTAASMYDQIMNLYEFGFPKGERILFPNFDNLITWRTGELTMITGIPNSGKSEFMDEIYMRLAALHGWKFGVFSAENQPPEIHFAKIAEKYTGEQFFSRERKMSLTSLHKAHDFINDHFFFIRTDVDCLSIEYLLEKGRELILRKGINALIIDPWNRVEHDIPQGMSETQYINLVLTKIYNWKEVNNCAVYVVAHPVKIKKDKLGQYEIATLYDIAGSAHFFNKTDNGISIYRNFANNEIHVYVQKIRFKFIGRIGSQQFEYDLPTGRYKEIDQLNFNTFMDSEYPKDWD